MAKNAKFESERKVNTYTDLAHGANVLIDKSESDQKGSYYTIMGSILLTAFTFEAYLNHVGEKIFKFWEEIEYCRVKNKYKIIFKELDMNPDYSTRPYNILASLFNFRNSVAHGKSQILIESKKISWKDDLDKHKPKTVSEEYCNLKNAKRAKEDIRKIILEMHDVAGVDEFAFDSGLTISSVTEA